MKNYKLLLGLSLLIFVSVGAQSDCNKSKISNQKNANAETNKAVISNKATPEKPVSTPQNESVKTLAEGSNGKVENPFIFVARTKEAYAQLQTLAENLPPVSEIDFVKSAVVAAFAGTKNTGGYSVVFDKIGDEISVKVLSPPADAIVTEALTNPFKIALITLEEESSLDLELAENWKNAVQNYEITSGEFSFSGGFVGREVRFEAEGTVGVLTSGELVTLIFDLSGKDTEKQRKLAETASGKLKDGKTDLARLEAGNFIELPHSPLVVSGTISSEKLSLQFEPGKREYVVSDGYEGRGKLEAQRKK